jgi:hypothetical protein
MLVEEYIIGKLFCVLTLLTLKKDPLNPTHPTCLSVCHIITPQSVYYNIDQLNQEFMTPWFIIVHESARRTQWSECQYSSPQWLPPFSHSFHAVGPMLVYAFFAVLGSVPFAVLGSVPLMQSLYFIYRCIMSITRDWTREVAVASHLLICEVPILNFSRERLSCHLP